MSTPTEPRPDPPQSPAEVESEVIDEADSEFVNGEESEPLRRFVRTEVRTEIERYESFSGPLPHPDILKQYEEIVPGAANRIMSMAERQSDHRITLEHEVVFGGSKRSRTGMYLGFTVFVLFLVASFILLLLDKTLAGLFLGGFDVGGLVLSLIFGRRSQANERIRKGKAST